jgi:hypothetical protein
MTWLHEALVTIFNAAVWEAGTNGRIPLADMPALGQWMAQGWPPVQHDVMDADEFLWFALDAVSLGSMCQCGELARLTFPGDEEITFDDEWGDA